jgi:hypothetical protein
MRVTVGEPGGEVKYGEGDWINYRLLQKYRCTEHVVDCSSSNHHNSHTYLGS